LTKCLKRIPIIFAEQKLIKLTAVIFFTAFFLFLSCQATHASTRVDISSGSISGKNADFKFNIPTEWQNGNYVYAESVTPPRSMRGVLDLFRFYCVSDSGRFPPALLFELYVFRADLWNERNNDLFIIHEGYNYVYAADYAEFEHFGFGMHRGSAAVADHIIFGRMFSPVGSVERLRPYIVQSDMDAGRSTRITLFGNRVLTRSPHIDSQGRLYLPVRELSEALGCTVAFRPNGSIVIITNGPHILYQFPITGSRFVVNNIRMVVIDGTLFAQPAFFNIMRVTADVDNNGNVSIMPLFR
jgi:hypothetical protein